MFLRLMFLRVTELFPNFWGAAPHAVNWVLLLFVVVCFVVALRVIVKALPALLLIGAVSVLMHGGTARLDGFRRALDLPGVEMGR